MTALSDFIRPRFVDPATVGPYGAMVYCSLTSNQDNLVVGVALGTLTLVTRGQMKGELQHYFSDRTWDDPTTFARESNPFNPKAADRTGIILTASGTEALKITTIALSWGGGQTWLPVVGVAGNVVHCQGPGAGAPRADYLLSLSLPVPIPG